MPTPGDGGNGRIEGHFSSAGILTNIVPYHPPPIYSSLLPPWHLDNYRGGMSTAPPRDAGVLEMTMSSRKFVLHNSHQHGGASVLASSLMPT